MSKDFYIPEEGIAFRLCGYVSQCVLVSRARADQEISHFPVAEEYADQFFTLVHGTGTRQGLYLIKSKVTNKVLFSRTSPGPTVGHVDGDGKFDDNWFKLEPGTGNFSNYFRLVVPYSKTALVSRTSRAPQVTNHPSSDVFADQYFAYLFEDMVVDSVEYDLKLGKILSSEPIVLADQSLDNVTAAVQQMSFQVSDTETHTSSFDYTLGFTITVGTKFKTGIPFVAEGEIKVDASVKNEFAWGSSTTTSKTYNATLPVSAAPGESVRATSTVTKGRIECPFTIHLSSKSSGAKTQTKGTWRGLTTWDLRHSIQKVTKPAS